MGFKTKEAAAANLAEKPECSKQANSKKKSGVSVNLGPKFDAIIIDKQAPPPPGIPISTLQAIGTGPCKMSHKDVSSKVLTYDSSVE